MHFRFLTISCQQSNSNFIYIKFRLWSWCMPKLGEDQWSRRRRYRSQYFDAGSHLEENTSRKYLKCLLERWDQKRGWRRPWLPVFVLWSLSMSTSPSTLATNLILHECIPVFLYLFLSKEHFKISYSLEVDLADQAFTWSQTHRRTKPKATTISTKTSNAFGFPKKRRGFEAPNFRCHGPHASRMTL